MRYVKMILNTIVRDRTTLLMMNLSNFLNRLIKTHLIKGYSSELKSKIGTCHHRNINDSERSNVSCHTPFKLERRYKGENGESESKVVSVQCRDKEREAPCPQKPQKSNTNKSYYQLIPCHEERQLKSKVFE
jgi:hypothetical protein